MAFSVHKCYVKTGRVFHNLHFLSISEDIAIMLESILKKWLFHQLYTKHPYIQLWMKITKYSKSCKECNKKGYTWRNKAFRWLVNDWKLKLN